MLRRGMKCAAVLIGTVLALTGFSSHGGHGNGHHASSGGGCSNSRKSNDDSGSGGSTSATGPADGSTTGYANGSTTGNPTGSTPGPGGGSVSGTTTATTSVVTACASAAQNLTSSTVHVTVSSGSGSRRYRVEVTFRDAADALVDEGSTTVNLGPGASRDITVPMDHPELIARVDHCEATVRPA
ncbi:hypothetical protein ACFYM2_00385 [Streptomyces sp. NPDC006711]|uniref:hypothetical protein n=1 Tax=Streptomyces sp. NPDC006711 TaxID=3364762 RepID=UPI0036C33D13